MRKFLIGRFFLNMLTANLVFPITVGPWITILLLRSLAPGHSDSVAQQLTEADRTALLLQILRDRSRVEVIRNPDDRLVL